MRTAASMLCVLIAGCQVLSVDHAPSGRTVVQGSGVRVHLSSGDRILTGVLVALVVADAMQYYVRGDDGTLTRLSGDLRDIVRGEDGTIVRFELDPSRRVAVQDCTQPVNPELGNLLCR